MVISSYMCAALHHRVCLHHGQFLELVAQTQTTQKVGVCAAWHFMDKWFQGGQLLTSH
jgi:hypothetical protein